ncbi:hypothetical protein QC9_1821, partial [Clostridioides difficile CD39]
MLTYIKSYKLMAKFINYKEIYRKIKELISII